MISVKNLCKSFGDLVAVDNVSLKAMDGMITGLLGPNGAGKTTILRTIYGLQQPDQGEVLIDNINVSENLIPAVAKMGIFPDSIGLYDRLTTREHLQFYGEMHGLRGAKLDAAIEKTQSYFQLDELLDRRCKGFSHGQQMKVALSRALIHSPQNLILDEPTNGLDVMSIRTLRKLLFSLRDDGVCILFSSHVMQEVSALCDHIFIMAEGKMVAEGSRDRLCEISGEENLEDAFVKLIGTDEGIAL
ncbi:MAG: ATP-binding cassette domain-containing protein [Gammaproteobacteria bacterium]|nr:ATP-binding cassette domain-containing protein [Gammaproteobacteria bacterium]